MAEIFDVESAFDEAGEVVALHLLSHPQRVIANSCPRGRQR